MSQTDQRTDSRQAAAERSPAVAEISREIVRLHARYYGRGPTRSKTIWRDEIIVCILGDIFTRGEQVLVDAGHFEQVRSSRQSFQDTMEPLMRGVVEGITGRRVRSFLSQISPEGLASEVFALTDEEPARPDPRIAAAVEDL